MEQKKGIQITLYSFMLKMTSIGILACMSNILLIAQAPEVEWIRGYGNPYGSHVHHGMQTSDGGFVGVGVSLLAKRSRPVGLIVKTDSLGNLEWLTNVGEGKGFRSAFVNQIEETNEGNFIVAGALNVNGEQDRALFFLDNKGRLTSYKTYPAKGFDAIEGIDITSDGGIVVTGFLNGDQPNGFIIYDGECFIMKTDAEGNLLWDKRLDPVFHGMRILQTWDEGYAVCSNIQSETEEDLDFCLLKTDDQGNLEWFKAYGGAGLENCFDFDITNDKGFILGGHTRTFAKVTDGWDAWLVKTDSAGNLEWHQSFGEPLGGDPLWIYDECYGVKTTPDGGYVMACGTGIEPENVKTEDPNNFWASYIIRTDKKGNLLWEHIYKREDIHNAAEYININRDGSYIVFLDADGLIPRGANAFGFMKLSPDK